MKGDKAPGTNGFSMALVLSPAVSRACNASPTSLSSVSVPSSSFSVSFGSLALSLAIAISPNSASATFKLPSLGFSAWFVTFNFPGELIRRISSCLLLHSAHLFWLASRSSSHVSLAVVVDYGLLPCGLWVLPLIWTD